MKSSLYRRNDSFAKTLAKVCLILLLSDTSIQAQGKPEPIDYSAELPRVPALEPEEAAKRIEVADGFEIQLVAAEPMINSPVAIEWDAKGGMFVCEMRGYSENRDDAISRVRYLTDTNRDGTYDRVTTFAEGLLWPTAISPIRMGYSLLTRRTCITTVTIIKMALPMTGKSFSPDLQCPTCRDLSIPFDGGSTIASMLPAVALADQSIDQVRKTQR